MSAMRCLLTRQLRANATSLLTVRLATCTHGWPLNSLSSIAQARNTNGRQSDMLSCAPHKRYACCSYEPPVAPPGFHPACTHITMTVSWTSHMVKPAQLTLNHRVEENSRQSTDANVHTGYDDQTHILLIITETLFTLL